VKRILGCLLFATFFLFCESTSVAGQLIISSPDNLSNIQVGQTISFEIALAGLAPNATLDALGATVQIQAASLFSTPVITPGNILPAGGGFFAGPNAGIADGTYDMLFNATNTPINSDGIFFSFQVQAVNPGSGTIDFSSISAFQGFDPVLLTNGTPDGLAFTILSSQPTSTPEPSTVLLSGIGIFTASLYSWGRRKSHRMARFAF
jgi:hypothetical protein